MTEREIAFDGNPGTYLTVCPCCGGQCAGRLWGCDECWKEHRDVLTRTPMAELRDELYRIGLRLRAEGKMPPLKTGPAAAAVCSECGASPCDCEKEIWTYQHRLENGQIQTQDPGKRAAMVGLRTRCSSYDRCERGPVQRVSEPPHDFGKTSGPGAHGPQAAARSCGRPDVSPADVPQEPAFSSATLARALFDEEMQMEACRRSEWGAAAEGDYAGDPSERKCRDESAPDGVRRVLDIMWAGKGGAGSTKPDVRKRAEELAARVVARMGRKA